MRISVVIPVKDDPRIVACVASIRAAAGDFAPEIIVVDNDSASAFRNTLRALEHDGVRVLAASGTVYAARNRAIEASTGEAILFTDADCEVDPAWLTAAVAALAAGADLVQGLSGSSAHTWRDRLIQARYEAPFRALRPGAPVECDTRNLAVRRAVFDRLRFNEAYRRVGDTELGLRAEALGFRVAFAPAMRIRHAHEPALDVLIAKQICHGWGAQRLMHEAPGLPWHGGHLRLAAKWGPGIRRIPGHRRAGAVFATLSIYAARALDRLGPRLPFRLSLVLLGALDKSAGLAGHLMYKPDASEPSPSALLNRPLPRN